MPTQLRPPERLTDKHDLSQFQSAEPRLDQWLRKHALNSEGRTSRTYVVCSGEQVVGFFSLATGCVQLDVATSKVRRNAPNPAPVMILGRLAVAKAWEGRKIGRSMLRDAILKTLQASEIAGISAILLHAISDDAKRFYEKYGFEASNIEPMTLMITLKDAEKSL